MNDMMPADDKVELNHEGVPYTFKLALWLSWPLNEVVMVALVPLVLAASNHPTGTAYVYRRVRPETPAPLYEVKVRSATPGSFAVIVNAAPDTSELP
jgi:hypothetical protein